MRMNAVERELKLQYVPSNTHIVGFFRDDNEVNHKTLLRKGVARCPYGAGVYLLPVIDAHNDDFRIGVTDVLQACVLRHKSQIHP